MPALVEDRLNKRLPTTIPTVAGKKKPPDIPSGLPRMALTLSGSGSTANPVGLAAERLHNAVAAGRFPLPTSLR
jgi:hypothetical protein